MSIYAAPTIEEFETFIDRFAEPGVDENGINYAGYSESGAGIAPHELLDMFGVEDEEFVQFFFEVFGVAKRNARCSNPRHDIEHAGVGLDDAAVAPQGDVLPDLNAPCSPSDGGQRTLLTLEKGGSGGVHSQKDFTPAPLRAQRVAHQSKEAFVLIEKFVQALFDKISDARLESAVCALAQFAAAGIDSL